MIALAYVGLAWLFGVIIADITPPPEVPAIEHAGGGRTTCRPMCMMSGSFKNGVIRTLEPWPFRRGQMYECPKHGDKDLCTGETYLYGHWMPPDVILKGDAAVCRTEDEADIHVTPSILRWSTQNTGIEHDEQEVGSERIIDGKIDTTKL